MNKKFVLFSGMIIMWIVLIALLFVKWGKSLPETQTAPEAPYESRLIKSIKAASEKAGMSSTFIGSIGHFRVKQETPNIRCVKKLSVFINAINQTVAHQGAQLLSIAPCGDAVEIDGELAYSEVIVVIAPSLAMTPPLLQVR